MIDKLLKQRFFPLYLFLFAFFVYTFFSWATSIYILDEARNSTCAREMLDAKDFFVPTYNSVLRTDKPPLHYYFMMLSYRVFGVNAFAARFFSAIFGALTILVTFLFSKKFLDKKTAFWTSFSLLASIHLSIQFHLAVPDPYLIFFFTSSLFLFYSALKTNNIRDKILMYVAIGLGTLTKGPVAILLPGFIFLLHLIFTKQFKWSVISKLKPFTGVLIVLAVALPWYIINGIQTDWEWTNGFFFRHNLNRFSGEMEGHGGIFLITFAYVFIGLFPFSLFFPQAFRQAFKNKSNEFIVFNLIAGIAIVAFFSVSQTKLPNYTVPSYPFLAIVLANYFSNNFTTYKQIRINFPVLLLLGILIPIAGFLGMRYDSLLAPLNMQALWFLVLPLGFVIAFLLRKKVESFLLAIGITTILASLLFFGIVFPAFDKENPVIKSLHLLEGKEVASFEKFNSSYSFYLKREIKKIELNEFESFFQAYPDGRIISTTKKLKQIELPSEYEIVFSSKDLFEAPTTVIIARKTSD
jgi:4-amino-4-deoxy-L-arabinose transferase-like glycosyltransferase